jgi:hypothetical protein
MSSLIEDAVEEMRKEFGDKADSFKSIALRMNELNGADFEKTKFPGVYVLIHEDKRYIKVGKSQSNPLKRALEHFSRSITVPEYTALQMPELRHCDKMHVLIFLLEKPDSAHWVLALENYLERKLNPIIHSKRNG